MNEFEFLRGLPFGPYLPSGSFLQRLDPRTRILLAAALMLALVLARRPLGLGLGLAAILLAWRAARVPFEPLRRGWQTALPFLLILALIQVLFRRAPGEEMLFLLAGVTITAGDLWAGAALLLRFGALIALLGLAAASLSEAEITRGLEALLGPLALVGIPAHDLVLAVQVTLRYFSLLAQTAERIAKAQAARGADWRPAGWNLLRRARQITPLIVPLFVTSLRRAENMALAMDARGYGSLPVRTSMVTLRYTRADAAALLAGLALSAALLVV